MKVAQLTVFGWTGEAPPCSSWICFWCVLHTSNTQCLGSFKKWISAKGYRKRYGFKKVKREVLHCQLVKSHRKYCHITLSSLTSLSPLFFHLPSLFSTYFQKKILQWCTIKHMQVWNKNSIRCKTIVPQPGHVFIYSTIIYWSPMCQAMCLASWAKWWSDPAYVATL